MAKVVGVRFRNVGKIYYFNPKEYKMKIDDISFDITFDSDPSIRSFVFSGISLTRCLKARVMGEIQRANCRCC